MSAATQEKRAPYFNTNVDVDVDIAPWELEAAGWVYVGKGAETTKAGEIPLPPASYLAPFVAETHDEEHDGPMRWCQHRLCRAIEDYEPEGDEW